MDRNSRIDRLRAGTSLGGVPREQKILKGHLPRVIYHQVYKHAKKSGWVGDRCIDTLSLFFAGCVVCLVVYDTGFRV